MSDIEMEDLEDKVCVKCGDRQSCDQLDQVGTMCNEASRKKHPLFTLIYYATKSNLNALAETLKSNQESGKPTFIHNKCRTELRNLSRRKRPPDNSSNKRQSLRLEYENFDFKSQCFYCDRACVIDLKHPDRNKFEEVRTKDTGIYKRTLEICKNRTDDSARKIESRLLTISDLVAAEARYHVTCRLNFEHPLPTHKTPGRPIESGKKEIFEQSCAVMENDIELYTVSEFHKLMLKISNENEDSVYSVRMTQSKLTQKYGDTFTLVTKQGRSNIILLDRVKMILCEEWYTKKKSDEKDESERVVIAAAQLIKDAIRQYEHNTELYPSVDDIKSLQNEFVPQLLKVFMNELVKSPIKQVSISQTLFSAARPRTIMPLNFGLAVSVDNCLASKWMINLLHKLGFCVSYDEVIRYKQNVVKHDQLGEIICPNQTSFLQFVSDNTDHDMATLDGKGTHHGLGSIAIANGAFTDISFERQKLPRDKREAWKDIKSNEGIRIVQYLAPNVPALTKTMLTPLIQQESVHSKFVDLLWNTSFVFKAVCPSWSGYMSSSAKKRNNSKSLVSMLPIIDLHATDPSALYSLLLFLQEQSQKLNIGTVVVTFDQQLYIKAYEIVASMKMNVFLRLGGFHQLMSFLGSIGTLMEGSGLRTALESLYAPVTIGHMMTGKAYARAIRGHFLATSSLLSILLAEFWDSLNEDDRKTLESIYDSEDLWKHQYDEIATNLVRWYHNKKDELSKRSRTSALWFSYIEYIFIVQEFIRAERTSNWVSHFEMTKSMLNLFAATGHNNYAKTCRLYIQSVETLKSTNQAVYQQFQLGNHTVKRTATNWSGIWTDLSIEQILMKSLKGRSGIIGRGVTENVMNVWTKTMHRCAEVTDSINVFTSLMSDKSENHIHKEFISGRVKRDHDDYIKLKEWFEDHNPFSVEENLVALDTGLTDIQGKVTCDRAEEVGASIQDQITGKSFTTCSFKRKNQIVTLQTLYSSVKIGNEKVTIDPLTLFLRLVVMIERKPDEEIDKYFEYELSPFPMSLFNDGCMRSSQKSKLKSFLLKDVPDVAIEEGIETNIVDGGALLWCCNWKKNQSFQAIFQMCANFLRFLKINTVVFDGYALSTKDVTHQKRSGNVSSTVEIKEINPCPSDRNSFLSNYKNKEEFVKFLARKLRILGLQVIECPSDADTTIVKVAIETAKETPANVYSDDTDVLCLLLHHCHNTRNLQRVNIINMTRKTDQQRHCYTISDVTDRLQDRNQVILTYLLFAHAFTGCDTTSAIHRFGKSSIFTKLQHSKQLRGIADIFNKPGQSPEQIGTASISFFESLHSPISSLAEIRKKKYEDMVVTSRANIDPSILPPSPRAAFFHGLRVYHQLQVWLRLMDTDCNPLDWGWEMKDGLFSPVMTDNEPGPQDLLKMISCSCKDSCDKRCSCKKAGLKCSISCRECLGAFCGNAVAEPDVENENDSFERHFLDIFD